MTEEYFEYNEPAAIGVSFRRSGRVYYFAPNGLRVRQGDQVLAETDKGVDIGEVVFVKYDLGAAPEGRQLKALLRRATPEDLAKEEELRQKEREARRVCEEKITAHNLPMRLIAADYTFDGQRLVFFFSAETRVDFRALVRDLAETFKTRIELRQVGVRDQAKMIGGLGPCGRPLCCNAFLRNFDPVGIRVAKDQGLSLNPAKISGICDRLMCCLRYEHETYCELARKLPKAGQTVNTAKGQAVVKHVNLMYERVQVQYANDETEDLKADQVWALDAPRPEGVVEAPPPAPPRSAPEPTERPPRTRQRPPRGESADRPRPSRRGAETPAAAPADEPPAEAAPGEEGASASRRRRRRRSSKRKAGEVAVATAPAATAAPAPSSAPEPRPASPAAEGAAPAEGQAPRRRRRPRTRPRRKGPGPTPSQE
jgi:cell fate regulator YaaT (PSP1 superfamily)